MPFNRVQLHAVLFFFHFICCILHNPGRTCWSWAAAQVQNSEEVTQTTNASWQDVWWGLFCSEGSAAARFTRGEILRLKTHGTSIFPWNGNWHWIFFNLRIKQWQLIMLLGSELTCQIIDQAKVVVDGNLITGKGLGTVVDFALAIIRKFFGHGRAKAVANGIVFEYPKS